MAMFMPGEASGMPNDFGFEQQQSARKRKLAEALRQQSNAPQGQMVGGIYVAPSITQYLSGGLKGYQAYDMEKKADQAEKDAIAQKNMAYAKILADNKAKQVEGAPTVTSTMPAYTPEQQDQFGSPLPNVQRQPIQTSTPNYTQETPQQVADRQRQSVYDYVGKYGASPEAQLLLSDYNHQRDRGERREDITDQRTYEGQTHARDVGERREDIKGQQEFQRIMAKDQQGFQLTQQEKQFAQQFALQQSSQGFQAGQQSRNQAFQSGENEKNREQQLIVAGLKGGANSPQQKVTDAKDVLSILNQAAPLVNKSTGSGIGNMIDESAQFLGTSTPGAQAAAQLKALEGSLVSKMPKMSGPQSDKDVLLYKQMAGQIGDPRIPAAQKQAAMNTINELNSRYAGVPVQPLPYGNPTMTPTTALGGITNGGYPDDINLLIQKYGK